MRFLMVPMDRLLGKPVLDQGLDVFRFQGAGRHAPIAQLMELVGHQGQHPLAFVLGAIGALPALAAELFELVVQVSHRVLSIWLVFLTTWQPELDKFRLTRNSHGAQPPIDLTMPGHRQRGSSSVEGWPRAIQHARARAVLECGYTSFEVSRTDSAVNENEHGTTIAKGNRRARGSWLKTGGACENGQAMHCLLKMDRPWAARYRRWIAACADAPVTRSGGALFATLPQWPRINPITCVEYRHAFGPVTDKSHHRPVWYSRRNPRGIRACPEKSLACFALRSRMRPRHYRASLCSDTAARTWQPVRQAIACHTGCIRKVRTAFGWTGLITVESPVEIRTRCSCGEYASLLLTFEWLPNHFEVNSRFPREIGDTSMLPCSWTKVIPVESPF